ncbi:hypothetical protein D3C81_1993380 [compost metagenome]
MMSGLLFVLMLVSVAIHFRSLPVADGPRLSEVVPVADDSLNVRSCSGSSGPRLSEARVLSGFGRSGLLTAYCGHPGSAATLRLCLVGVHRFPGLAASRR